MGTKDPRIDAYIAKSAEFAKPIVTHIRKLVHANCPEVTETLKWSMPHFEYKGGVFCGMAAFKAHATFGFWLGELLKIESKLDKGMGQFGRITSRADLPGDKEFASLIKAAMKLHDEGAKAPVRANAADKKTLVVPDYFIAAVKKQKGARDLRGLQSLQEEGLCRLGPRGQNRCDARQAPHAGGGVDE